MTHINTISVVNGFKGNNSPARVNRKTGHLFLNSRRWNLIDPAHRLFILLHEQAHCTLDSSDEKAVDELAQKWYVEMGYPLTESVFALTRILDDTNPAHSERMWLQYRRALQIDRQAEQNHLDSFTEDIHELKGVSRKERKRIKKEIKLRKKLGRGNKKLATANQKQAEADTRYTYAEQGIYVPTRAESISKTFGGLIQTAKSFMPGGAGQDSIDPAADPGTARDQPGSFSDPAARMISPLANTAISPASPAQGATTAAAAADKNKKILLIGGAAAAVLLIVAIVAVKSRS